MSILFRHADSPFAAADWQPEVMQVLDEHHLVGWSRSPRRCSHFAASLQQFLGSQRDVDVCVLHGRFITDLDSFCHQLERVVAGAPLERRVEGTGGVTGLLRSRHTFRGRPASKFRFLVWNDADALLRADAPLFGRLVDAIAGVAAEAEYVSDDHLLIQRAVFVGGPILDEYAGDPRGQFGSWVTDFGSDPFWAIVTGLERPPVVRYPIDELIHA